MSVNDLLSRNGLFFLQSAYQTILLRDIDENGQIHYLARMRAGCRKYDVIADLAKSKEAQKIGAVIPGLKNYLSRHWWADIFVIGWIVRRFYDVERNDSISRQIRALQVQLAVDGLGNGDGNSIGLPAGMNAGSSLGHVERFHNPETHLALDVTRQDDLSPDTIAIYALLKSPV